MRSPGLTLAILLATPAAQSWAQSPPADPALAKIKRDIDYLASDECEGRGTETKGLLKAGEYVAKSFAGAGLKPGGTDGYFQPFNIAGPPRLGSPNAAALKVAADGKGDAAELAFGKDFTPLAASQNGKFAGELVFAGYGIQAPDLKYDDYAGLDVAGKVVVVLRRAPKAGTKDNPLEAAEEQHQSLATKIGVAAKLKAAGLVFVNDAATAKAGDALLEFRQVGQAAPLAVLHAKRPALDAAFAAAGKSLDELEKGINADLTPRSLGLKGATLSGEITVQKAGLPTRNVVAVCPGSGPLANETVVVGAHYDHLGFGETGSLGGRDGKGKIHYGADDNGSGTTGLLELARRLGAMTNRQGRRIVLVAFAGEERGLFGSKHYCQEPPFPLDKTVFMVNMDMIGRVVPVADAPANSPEAQDPKTPQKDRLVVYGHGTAEGLEAVVDGVNARLGFRVLKVPGGTGPSDHDSFYRKKIPVLFFFTGIHKDYHRPSDTADKINVAGLAKVVDFAEACTLYAASNPAKLKYLVTKGGWEDPTEPKRGSPSAARPSLPKLGIAPGNYESEEGGVLVDSVSPGGAAEKGGIKDKDVIVEIGGKPVKDIASYMSAMGAQKANVEIEVVVVRQGKKVAVKVTPLP